MDRILNFFAPPKPEHGEAGQIRWQWGVSVGMYSYAIFAFWALGLGTVVGVNGSGLARSAQAIANAQAVEEVKLTVKCGHLQSLIQSLTDSIYEVERQIEIDGPQARDSDRRRLASLSSELRQKEDAYRSLECALILES